MDPVLVQLGPLAIRWYGLLIALGVLAGSVWSLREARRREMDADALLERIGPMAGLPRRT